MTSRSDPPRLLDPKSGSPKLLRDALRAGRDDLPRSDQLERMSVRLSAAIFVPPALEGGFVPPMPAPRGFWKWPVLRFGGPMVLVVGVGAGLWMAAQGGVPSRATLPAGDPAMRESISAEPPRVLPAPVVEVRPTADPEPARQVEPETPRRAPPQDKPAVKPRAPELAPPGDIPPTEVAPPAEQESEVRLLHKAQDDVEKDPERALVRVSEHERRFARGVLVQEREVLAIAALMHLGRSGEAHARAIAFRQRFPGSAHLPRIEALLDRRADATKSQPGRGANPEPKSP